MPVVGFLDDIYIYIYIHTQVRTQCSESRLIGCAGNFWECLISTHRGIPSQTESHSFRKHPTQWVSVEPLTVTEALFCCTVLSLWLVWDTILNKEFPFMIVMWKNSYKSCRRNFHLEFPDTSCPPGDTISKLVQKVRINSILIDRKPLKRNHVLSEENLDDIVHWLENSPWKYLWRLALQSGVSVGSVWTATKLFIPSLDAPWGNWADLLHSLNHLKIMDTCLQLALDYKINIAVPATVSSNWSSKL
jgi:hypothetical protein